MSRLCQSCPTCGAALHHQFGWSAEKREFQTGDHRIRFSKTESRIFDVLWHRGRHAVFESSHFIAAVYGDDIDGGPECFSTISIHFNHMRRKLEPAGYTITQNLGRPRQGWKLVRLVGDEAVA